MASVKEYAKHIERIRAEEALVMVERLQVASGLMKKSAAQKVINRWKRKVNQRRTKKPSDPRSMKAQLAAMGLAVREVDRGGS